MKGRKEITRREKIDFSKKLQKIYPCYDENENYSHFENNISHLTILFQAKNYVKKNFIKLSEDNLLNFAEEFLKALTFSDDRMTINKATIGQHKNKSRYEMRHLLVAGEKN